MGLAKVNIELTARQVELLSEYAYPFEDEQNQLDIFRNKPADSYVLSTDDFYAPRLIGDLVYSAKRIEDEFLLDELDELSIVIENAITMSK